MPYYYKAEEELFGPVDFETVYAWATLGDLDPRLLVSKDDPEGDFKPAAEWPEFELEWEVTSEEGVYGPLHVEAVIQLLEAETIAPDDEAREVATDETYEVVDLSCAVLMQKNEALTEELAAAQEQSDAATEAARYDDVEIPHNKREWRDTLKQRDELAKEAAKWQKFYEDLGERSARNTAQLNDQMEQLKADEQASADRIRNLEKQRRTLEEKNLELQEAALSGKSVNTDGSVELLNMKRAYNELSDKLENVLDQLTARTEQLEKVYAQRDELELTVRHKEDELNQTIREEREENKQIRRQHMDLENLHHELLRNFRELNDKMVQIRNDPDFRKSAAAEPPSAPPAATSKRERKKKERGKPRLKMT